MYAVGVVWQLCKYFLLGYALWAIVVAIAMAIVSRVRTVELKETHILLSMYNVYDAVFHQVYRREPADTAELCRGLLGFPFAVLPYIGVGIFIGGMMLWDMANESVSRRWVRKITIRKR